MNWSKGTAINLTEIKVNVEEAQAVLAELLRQAEVLREQKRQLADLAVQTEACWQGSSADVFREFVGKAVAEQESIAADLESSVRGMQRTIQQLVDQDASLARLIRGSGCTGGGRHG